jgi:hypothetical protein
MPPTRDPTVPRWLELGFYALVALLGVGPALARGGHVVGDGVDLYGTLWFYWWIQDCLVHLRDPGFTELFFHPLGKDIFAHTGNNFVDALISAPFQWVLRFPRYQPVFVATILLGNALSFRPLAARFAGAPERVPWWRRALGGGRASLAGFVATGLWMGCSYTLFEITAGRPTQAFLWFLPLALDRLLALEQPDARWRDAVAAGLFTALQALVYWFMGYFQLLLWLWLGAWALLRGPERRALLGRYALASLCCLAVVAPFAVAMALEAGAGAVPGLIGGQGLLAGPESLANNVATQLHGYWMMERWGAPMLGHATWLAVIALVAWKAPQRLRWLGAALLLLAVGLGPAIPTAGGESVPWYPYLLLYNTVPFLDRLWFPYRIVVMVFLLISACTGAALVPLFRRLAASRPRLAGWGPALVATLLLGGNLLEQNRQLCWPFVTRDVNPPAVFRWIGEQQGALIHLPFGINQPAIVWQTIHGQPTFGGMGESARLLWPPGFERRLSNDLVRFLRRSTVRPERATLPSSARGLELLRQDGFRWVVLHRDLVESENRHRLDTALPSAALDVAALRALPLAATERIIEALGAPVAVEGPLVVWDLQGGAEPPPDLRASPELLRERTWEAEAPPAHEQLLRSRGRLRDPSAAARDHHPGQP